MNIATEKDVFIVYKPIGKTPKEMIDTLRLSQKISADVPLTYAGRLDPLAEGLLVILSGDRVHDKERFSHLDKTYEFSVLLGITTDTQDLLGVVTNHVSGEVLQTIQHKNIQEKVQQCFDTREQVYPMYSSKTVDGVPLWQYAREGKVPREIPHHAVSITSVKEIEITSISNFEILTYIEKILPLVSGDFRQKEILNKWHEILTGPKRSYILIHGSVAVSSGTYIRTLCEDIGKALDVPALAYHIKRIRVGEYMLK